MIATADIDFIYIYEMMICKGGYFRPIFYRPGLIALHDTSMPRLGSAEN